MLTRKLVAGVIFFVVKAKFLPRQQYDKITRWEYDYVEIGEKPVSEKGYLLAETEDSPMDADEWSIGSSSSVSPGPRSPDDDHNSWEGDTLGSHSDSEAQR